MKDTQYKEQREQVKANQASHELMMHWYATELGVSRSEVADKLEHMDDKRVAQLYKKYQEQL